MEEAIASGHPSDGLLTMQNILRKKEFNYWKSLTVFSASMGVFLLARHYDFYLSMFEKYYHFSSKSLYEALYLDQLSRFHLCIFAILTLSTLLLSALFFFSKIARSVYLIDFAVYPGLNKYEMPHILFTSMSEAVNWFTKESLDFQKKIQSQSGLGETTYFPPNLLSVPPEMGLEAARKECVLVFQYAITEVLRECKLKATDIDILITNCSLFNPTPSISEMIINHFKMRSNIKNFHLAGMGCSAGLIALNLARDLLQAHPKSRVLIFSTEVVTQAWYPGNDKSMMLANCLFRMGGAAILLSNRPMDRFHAKYRLDHIIRTNMARNDEAYNAIYQKQDAAGIIGVSLSKNLIQHVTDALLRNLSTLGPRILPWSEQLKFLYNVIRRKVFKQKIKTYTPDFKKAVDHICIHAGGRAVIDGLEKSLNLPKHLVLPSRAALFKFGNTSSSSIWYELAFIERHVSVAQGKRVWQLSFGSGINCNSAIWTALKPIHEKSRFEWNIDPLLKKINGQDENSASSSYISSSSSNIQQ